MDLKKATKIFLVIFICGLISCKSDTKGEASATTKEKITDNTLETEKNYKTDTYHSSDIVSIENIDVNLLTELITSLVNVERKSKNLQPVTINKYLAEAADLHNNYLTSIGKLTHEGASADTRDLRSRVNLTGGQFTLMAENIAMKSFHVLQEGKGNILTDNTYQDVALQFFELWKNSPGHYQNLIMKDLRFVGTAVAWNSSQNALYATQVFGG